MCGREGGKGGKGWSGQRGGLPRKMLVPMSVYAVVGGADRNKLNSILLVMTFQA